MNSKYIKTALFSYFRFGNQIKHIASECGFHNADMLLVKKDNLVEVEIKTSKSDFKNDFKKPKHEYYNTQIATSNMRKTIYKKGQPPNPNGPIYEGYEISYPNYFYFCVPLELSSYVLNYIKEHYPNYGLLVCSDEPRLKWQQRIKTVKRAKKLHSKPVDNRIKGLIASRMASEIANLWQRIVK